MPGTSAACRTMVRTSASPALKAPAGSDDQLCSSESSVVATTGFDGSTPGGTETSSRVGVPERTPVSAPPRSSTVTWAAGISSVPPRRG